MSRTSVYHGDPNLDAAEGPLPHGWYGHDATTSQDRAIRLRARDVAAKTSAQIDNIWRHLAVKRDLPNGVETFEGNPYEYNENEDIIQHDSQRISPRGVPSSKERMKAKTFADVGAEPASTWFPVTKRASLDKRISDAMLGVLRRALDLHKTQPIVCASHNMKCRSEDERRAMAAAMSGTNQRRWA